MKLDIAKNLSILVLSSVFFFNLVSARADAPAPKRADPTIEQRLEDLEAYVNNGARCADNTNNVSSKLALYDEKSNSYSTLPGPGHNAWQMVCAALVLFMTLPGLALFYGGLVRRKNVLSVVAQCLFIAGMVTILWWACGYSLVFHSGNTVSWAIWASPFSRAWIRHRTPITLPGFRRTSLRCIS